MPSHFARAAIPCIALVVCTSAVWAQVGGSNCPEPVANCQNFITVNATDSSAVNFIAADEFIPAADSTITTICWLGAYSPAPATDLFTVTVYLDVGGIPGPIIAGPFIQGFTLEVTRRDTGLVIDATTASIFEYTATLGTPVAVAAGFCYWVEILNPTLDIGTMWFWQWSDSANGGNDRFIQDGLSGGGWTDMTLATSGPVTTWRGASTCRWATRPRAHRHRPPGRTTTSAWIVGRSSTGRRSSPRCLRPPTARLSRRARPVRVRSTTSGTTTRQTSPVISPSRRVRI